MSSKHPLLNSPCWRRAVLSPRPSAMRVRARESGTHLGSCSLPVPKMVTAKPGCRDRICFRLLSINLIKNKLKQMLQSIPFGAVRLYNLLTSSEGNRLVTNPRLVTTDLMISAWHPKPFFCSQAQSLRSAPLNASCLWLGAGLLVASAFSVAEVLK